MADDLFEGTQILELLARIDAVDDFMAAVDGQDIKRATELMEQAGVDKNTIALTLVRIVDPYDEP